MAMKKPKVTGLYIKKLKKGDKYQSRLWNPYLKRIGKIKTWEEKDLSVVITKHLEFKKKYEANNYDIITEPPKKKSSYPVLLVQCAAFYERYLLDDPEIVPEQKRKNLGERYIKSSIRNIKTFLNVLSKNGYNVSHCHISVIDDEAVGIYYKYLEERLISGDIKKGTWNVYMASCKDWFSVLINKFNYNIENPFKGVKAKQIKKDPEFLETEEMIKLFNVINEKNGVYEFYHKGIKKIRNLYRPWLVDYILFSAFVGGRPNEIFRLKWKDIEEKHIKLDATKTDSLNYVFIHPYLRQLLDKFKKDKKTDDSYVLLPEKSNRITLQVLCSKSFSHFFKQTGIKKDITAYNLRHTYVNYVFTSIGEAGLSVHHKKETAVKHYLSRKNNTKAQEGKNIFNPRLLDFLE